MKMEWYKDVGLNWGAIIKNFQENKENQQYLTVVKV